MATLNFLLTLTETSPGSGPYYSAFYATESNTAYTPVTSNPVVYLPTVGSSTYVVADTQTTSFKLFDYPGGACDTCNTSSVTFVTPPTASQLSFCYSAYNSGSIAGPSLSASYTASNGEGGGIKTITVGGGVYANFCVLSGSSITAQSPLLITECGYSCEVDTVCVGCGQFIPPINGWTIAQCTGSTKYNITFDTTSSITIGTVVSGSDFNGCYFVSSSFTGSAANFNYISSSLFNVYADCTACAYRPPPYQWYASSNYATAFDACIGQSPNQILWSNSASLVNTQTYMYTDPGLTTPYNGLFNSYSRTGTVGDGSWAAAETDSNGMITGVTPC
jgi:hypothetical protein